ncbi:MAG: tripartite tricarboxylate transporter TctB family protein [Pseudomonadota bacterium]
MNKVRNRKDAASGLCLLAAGIILIFLSLRFHIWSNIGPGEGFYPFVVGLILTGLSAIIAVNGFRGEKESKKERQERPKEAETGTRVFFYVGLVVCYGLLFDKTGFLISSLAFLIFVLKYVEHQNWKVTIIVGLISVIASQILFFYLLGVPLPKGLIGKWL